MKRSSWALTLLFCIQVSAHSDANCSSREQCMQILSDVTIERQQKEVEALKLLGRATLAYEKATHSQERLKISLDRAQGAEDEQAQWDQKRKDLQKELRSLDVKLEASNTEQQEAEAAAKRAVAARAAALADRKHEAEISTMPAQERCLADFASCTAGLISLQVEQWMGLLHIFNRFFVALGSIALGMVLLSMPAEGQALGFAMATLVIVPVLVAGAFEDFLRLVGSPPMLLVMLAGLLTMLIAVVFLWQGASGLRLLLGAALALLFGDLVLVILQEWIPLVPTTLVALFALALGLFGASSGLHRQSATQAFAMAVPASLLVASGVVLIFSLPVSPEAYLEDIAFEIVPWAHYGDKKLGNFFSQSGRLLWLVLQLPALVRLLLAPPDVPPMLPRKLLPKPKEEVIEEGHGEAMAGKLTVRNYGVLGLSNSGRKAAPPDENTVLVDPAGLPFIHGDKGPHDAEGAAKANYEWLEISNAESFPQEVKETITEECKAKYHAYADGKKKCIHVVGPDFRPDGKDFTLNQAVEKLTIAYANVFEEFCRVGMDQGLSKMRLLPISGGIFSGPFKEDLPKMTAQAVQAACEQLSEDKKHHMMNSNIDMCIFIEKEFPIFASAFGQAQSSGAREDPTGKSPAEEELWGNTVAGRQARAETAAAAAAAAPEGDELDPVAATQLLQRTVEALQALESTLPPSTALAGVQAGPPPTHLARRNGP